MNLEGGTGAIKHMVSFGSFMEVYKVDKTFKIRTPNDVDPSDTDPNAPWLVQDSANVGCAHPIVARTIIQSDTFLRQMMVTRPVDTDAVMKLLHSAKEGLLACEAAVKKLHQAVSAVVESAKAQGVSWSADARAINPFPHVQELEPYCSDILVKANRQVRLVCEVVGCFVDLDRKHSNFDHLHKELEAKLGADKPFTEMVGEARAFVRHIVELRNFEEHPGDVRTVIHNFALGPAPKYEILMPSWEVVGKADHPREDVCRDAMKILSGLLELTEGTIIHGMLHWRDPRFDQFVIELDPEQRDAECPVIYQPGLRPIFAAPPQQPPTLG